MSVSNSSVGWDRLWRPWVLLESWCRILEFWCHQSSQFQAWYMQSYQAHMWSQVDPYPKVAGGRCSLCLASSMVHEEMKWVASTSAAPQSLQDGSPWDCPFFRMLNLEVSDSSPWQPSRRRILKFDFDVRWIQSAQWVTFQSGEGEKKFGAHMDNCCKSHFVSARFNSCRWAWVPRILVTHFFQPLLDGVFWKRIAMLGKLRSLIWHLSRRIQAFVWGTWSLHWRTCLGKAVRGRAEIDIRKEFLVGDKVWDGGTTK